MSIINNCSDLLSLYAKRDQRTQAALAQFEHQLLEFVTKTDQPAASWARDFITVALAVSLLNKKPERFIAYIEAYLWHIQAIETLPLSTIQGLIDLLAFASGSKWLTNSRAGELLKLFERKSTLYKTDNLPLSEQQTLKQSWVTLLLALDSSKVTITEDSLKAIEDVLGGLKSIFEEANYGIDSKQVSFAKQALHRLRISSQSELNILTEALNRRCSILKRLDEPFARQSQTVCDIFSKLEIEAGIRQKKGPQFEELNFLPGIKGRVKNNQFIIEFQNPQLRSLGAAIYQKIQEVLRGYKGKQSDYCISQQKKPPSVC